MSGVGTTTNNKQNHSKEGNLLKRGEINKNWKLRWFNVKDGKLYYFKRKQDQKFISFIPLEQSVIRECRNKEEMYNAFAFEVVTKTRTYYLAADNYTDQKDWMLILSLHTHLYEENELFIKLEEEIVNSIYQQSLEEEFTFKSSASKESRLSRLILPSSSPHSSQYNTVGSIGSGGISGGIGGTSSSSSAINNNNRKSRIILNRKQSMSSHSATSTSPYSSSSSSSSSISVNDIQRRARNKTANKSNGDLPSIFPSLHSHLPLSPSAPLIPLHSFHDDDGDDDGGGKRRNNDNDDNNNNNEM